MSIAGSCRFPTCRGSNGRRMAEHRFKPETPEQVARGRRLGGGRGNAAGNCRRRQQARAWAARRKAEHSLDLSALRGITLYEPEELVLAAGPGTPMAEIEQTLRRHAASSSPSSRPTSGRCSGGAAGAGTLGGVIACNLSGPRRHQGGRGARPFPRLHGGQRPGRGLQVRRPGGQERHRLRPLQADGRVLGHARR